MKYNRLGRTGLKVSEICLGTMTFGSQADEPASRAMMDLALDAGVNFFDCADLYPIPPRVESVGVTESILGRWLPGKRDKIVLTTKFRGITGPGPNDRGASRAHILDAVDASLRRLQTDYIDVYLIHFPDADTPIEETLRAMDDLVRWGKVRYIGCCNFEGWRLYKALNVSERLRISRFECAQNRYNLLYRKIESDLVPACLDAEVGIMAYNPLASGFLTGRYRRGEEPPEASRFGEAGFVGQRSRSMYWHDELFDKVDEFKSIANGLGVSPAQLAVAWVLRRPAVATAIVGARRPDQLAETLKAADVSLDKPALEAIEALRPKTLVD